MKLVGDTVFSQAIVWYLLNDNGLPCRLIQQRDGRFTWHEGVWVKINSDPRESTLCPFFTNEAIAPEGRMAAFSKYTRVVL